MFVYYEENPSQFCVIYNLFCRRLLLSVHYTSIFILCCAPCFHVYTTVY
jgi:hypothetical protein